MELGAKRRFTALGLLLSIVVVAPIVATTTGCPAPVHPRKYKPPQDAPPVDVEQDPSTQSFLIRDGQGNADSTLAYYRSLDGVPLDHLNLTSWQAEFLNG